MPPLSATTGLLIRTFCRCTFVACVAFYLLTAITGFPGTSTVCLAARPVLHGQAFRVFTAALSHAGLLHVGMNMLAFLPLGASLERHFGSLQLLWVMLLLSALGGAMYVVVAAASAALPLSLPAILDFYHQCAVGLSGVIFGLVLIDSHQASSPTRSIFGLFSVPTWAFPWALLVIWQLLVPRASLLGHLTGLLVGYAFATGRLRWLLPSSATYQTVERALPFCLHSPSFIAHTAGSGSDAVLPTRHAHDGDGNPHSGWLQGPWMPFPSSSGRLRMSGLNLSSLWGGSQPDMQQQAPQPPLQQQRGGGQTAGPSAAGVRLGGSQPPSDAKAAAAAAAEARLAAAGSKGTSSRSGGASGTGMV
ncbi:hypothetical protein ABPG77_001033 [Micractinium sp. CCAP 211/92]